MAAPIPFFRGRDVVLVLYQDNKKHLLPCKTWDVEHNATEVQEGVNGEYRDRLDLVTNFYSISLDVYQTDQEIMEMMQAAQDQEDASGLPLDQTCAIIIKQKDGTRASYVLQECVYGPWKLTQGGRAEAVMANLKIRFRFFKPVQSV